MEMAKSSGDVRHTFLSRFCSNRLAHSDAKSTADSKLTPLGEEQARNAHISWEKERPFGIPLPEKLYTSPLTRAIRTNQVTFDDTLFPSGSKTVIVEVCLPSSVPLVYH